VNNALSLSVRKLLYTTLTLKKCDGVVLLRLRPKNVEFYQKTKMESSLQRRSKTQQVSSTKES